MNKIDNLVQRSCSHTLTMRFRFLTRLSEITGLGSNLSREFYPISPSDSTSASAWGLPPATRMSGAVGSDVVVDAGVPAGVSEPAVHIVCAVKSYFTNDTPS